jgi:hypothetical protein
LRQILINPVRVSFVFLIFSNFSQHERRGSVGSAGSHFGGTQAASMSSSGVVPARSAALV